MTLIEKLRAAKAEKSQDARTQYFLALRTGKPAAHVLAAAEAAAIPQEQVESDAAVLEEAARLRPLAEQLPTTIRQREEALKRATAAQRELDEAVARLGPLALQASLAAREAERIERETRQRTHELRMLYASNPDLLPADSKPTIIKQLESAADAADTADTAKRGRTTRWLLARERVENAQAALNAIGKPHTFMGKRTSLSGPGEVAVEEQTAAALAELAAAEEERDAAGEAVDAQGQ